MTSTPLSLSLSTFTPENVSSCRTVDSKLLTGTRIEIAAVGSEPLKLVLLFDT